MLQSFLVSSACMAMWCLNHTAFPWVAILPNCFMKSGCTLRKGHSACTLVLLVFHVCTGSPAAQPSAAVTVTQVIWCVHALQFCLLLVPKNCIHMRASPSKAHIYLAEQPNYQPQKSNFSFTPQKLTKYGEESPITSLLEQSCKHSMSMNLQARMTTQMCIQPKCMWPYWLSVLRQVMTSFRLF